MSFLFQGFPSFALRTFNDYNILPEVTVFGLFFRLPLCFLERFDFLGVSTGRILLFSKQDGFRGNKAKSNRIKAALHKLLKEKEEAKTLNRKLHELNDEETEQVTGGFTPTL